MKSKKVKSKDMNEKITAKKFFIIQWKIIKELYSKFKFDTIMIIVLACITMSVSFIDLKFLEYTTNSISVYSKQGIDDNFFTIFASIILFLLALLIMRLLSNLYYRITAKYVDKVSFEVEKGIVNKLSNISYEYYENNQFHEKIDFARKASGQYSNAVFGITQIARIILMFVVYSVLLSKINTMFLVVILIALIINIILAGIVTDKQLDYWRKHVSPETRRNNYFKGVLGNRINHQNIQVEGSFAFFLSKYKFYNKCERKNYLKLNVLSFSSELVSSALFLATFIITILSVGQGVADGEYNIGYFSMVVALLTNLFSTVKSFTVFMLNSNWYIRVLEAYYEVMDYKEHNTIDCQASTNLIEIRNLKYKYSQTVNYVLKGINISFKKGEKIAVVGYNGSGKTTFVSIILSLLENYEGKYSCNDLCATAVIQDFKHYQMSVKENIEIGCGGKELNPDKINNILKMVGLYEFIKTKPDGIYTKLGNLEEGIELSKGQWQRLAIARLIANEKANVWILDEPTSYIDPLAEIDIYKLVFSLAKDRLVFFVSHRLGFAKYSDRIIVINDGYIHEDGSHQELINNPDSIYYKMYTAQMEWYTV